MEKESYTRTELYELLWTEPTTKVAMRIGISDVALGKWCKQYGSLTYIFSKEDGHEAFRVATDAYLIVALETKEFLVSNQKKNPEGKPEVVEAVIH